MGTATRISWGIPRMRLFALHQFARRQIHGKPFLDLRAGLPYLNEYGPTTSAIAPINTGV
jgi:hypothetical protein